MEFLNGWTIDISKLNKYEDFSKEFQEFIDSKLCQFMIDGGYIDNDEQRLMLTNTLKNVKVHKTDGEYLPTIHKQLVKSGNIQCGRFYPINNTSLIPLARYIKHTIFKKLDFIDIDMVSGHASIAISLAKLNGLKVDSISKYVNDRQTILTELSSYYSVHSDPLNSDNVKFLFNMLLYGGGFSTWIEELEQGDIAKGYKPKTLKTHDIHPFISSFIKDRDMIANIAINSNNELYECIQNKYPEMTNVCSINKNNRSFMSYYYQIIENEILYLTYNFLKKEKCIKLKHVCLEFDGLCIPNSDGKMNDFILEKLNDHLTKKTKLQFIKMAYKSYTSARDDIIVAYNEYIIKKSNDENEQRLLLESKLKDYCYEKVKEEFEVAHFKVIDKSFFIKIKNNGEDFVYFKKNDLLTSYSHMIYYEKIDGKIVTSKFITKWLDDPSIRTYDDLNVYPDESVVPDNIFNLWIPFTSEKINNFIEKNDELDEYNDFVKALCGDNEEVFNYFQKWVAQMIQYPEVKSTCPVFISLEGSGKGTLFAIISKMIGHKKVFNTTDPARDVWGNFNSLMANKFLVICNEISKKDCSSDKMKGLITEYDLTINPKGFTPYDITSYHRFIITTNNIDPIPLSTTDRRYCIIRSNDRYNGNSSFFTKLHALKENEDFIGTLYNYYKTLETEKVFLNVPIPVTEHSELLKHVNKSPIEFFIESYVEGNDNELKLSDKKLYDIFVEYKNSNGFEKFEMNSIKFGMLLCSHNIYKNYIKSRVSIKEDGKIVKGKIINIDGIRQHGKSCLC
jgi:hypothetical protein